MASVALFLGRQALRVEARWSHWSLDERLAAGFDPASDPALAMRAEQLCSARHRRRLAVSIERLVDASERTSRQSMSSAVPIVRQQVAAAWDSLDELAQELRDTQRPVRPRGVAIVERLLTDADSDLYTKTARGAVEIQVQAALQALRVKEDRIAEESEVPATKIPRPAATHPV